jgi:hypothetical protein
MVELVGGVSRGVISHAGGRRILPHARQAGHMRAECWNAGRVQKVCDTHHEPRGLPAPRKQSISCYTVH